GITFGELPLVGFAFIYKGVSIKRIFILYIPLAAPIWARCFGLSIPLQLVVRCPSVNRIHPLAQWRALRSSIHSLPSASHDNGEGASLTAGCCLHRLSH